MTAPCLLATDDLVLQDVNVPFLDVLVGDR
jgi:hypothetical protein